MKQDTGIELVGAYLSIQSPINNEYDEGRVFRVIDRTGKHLILYETDYDIGYETEYANLNGQSRRWRRATDQFAEFHNMSVPYSFIGRIVAIDADINDTPKEYRHKVACVLAVIHPKHIVWSDTEVVSHALARKLFSIEWYEHTNRVSTILILIHIPTLCSIDKPTLPGTSPLLTLHKLENLAI